jgi:hypothetical protein
MYIDIVFGVTFFQILHRIDKDLAEQTLTGGCPHCQGALHHASYQRKPRGGPPELPEEMCRRLSLCCARQGCRKRVLPPSCLFLGRKVYWGAIVLVVVAAKQRRPGSVSAAKLKSLFDVSRETVTRWLDFFAEVFPKSQVWKRCRQA